MDGRTVTNNPVLIYYSAVAAEAERIRAAMTECGLSQPYVWNMGLDAEKKSGQPLPWLISGGCVDGYTDALASRIEQIAGIARRVK